MTSFDGYDPTKEGAGDGIGPFDGPFFAQNMVVGDSAGATMMTHRGLADMADISGGPALAHLHHHSSSFGEYHHHPPLQQFADFRQHGDATDGTPTDPSLFDQLALAYSPLASPGGVHGLDVAGAGHLLPDDGHPPHPSSSLALTQPSPWPETSPATHAWIADTIYRSGPSKKATADPLDPSGAASPALLARLHSLGSVAQDDQTSHMFSPADYVETAPATIWDPGPGVADEASAVASSQGWSSTAGERASPEKVRKRRGRPRLYEDDGIEAPKRKPGRPLTYAPVTDSFGSRSSMTSSLSNISPGSADGPTAPFWDGPPLARSARPAKRNQPADEATEQDSGEGAAQAIIRTRNKAAATRYRLKIQNTVDRMEAEEREASLRRQALLACADRLRGEVNSLKTEVMQHANCGCPHISGYISAATQHTLAAMGAASPASQTSFSPSPMQELPAGVSSGPGVWQELDPALSYPHMHLASCPWQQGGFVVDNPVPGSYYGAPEPSPGNTGEVPGGNVDGYFQSSMSSNNADSG